MLIVITKNRLFTGYAHLFDFMLFLFSKIVFNGVQKLKGKCIQEIENIYVWHILSLVVQKRKSFDFSNSSCK